MTYILNIDTSTTLCSVAISKDGELLCSKEINNGYSHTENLHVFINDLLIQEKIIPANLSAIAVGSGPGSYTGLRIGVSAAKGIAFGSGIPLIAINSLQIMAQMVKSLIKDDVLLCPMLDARRMEVYTAIFDTDLNFTKDTSSQIISEENIEFFRANKPLCFFGDGMQKCQSILNKIPDSLFIENIYPSATALAQLSFNKFKAKQFEDVAYFEPYYLKDFMIGAK